MMRLLGVDYGSARMGIAMGDTESNLATPLETHPVKSMEDAWASFSKLAETEGVKTVIVGMPYTTFQEDETAQTREVKLFADGLRTRGFTVHEENELLSSKLAAVMSPGSQAKHFDAEAASIILQSWLDRSTRV